MHVKIADLELGVSNSAFYRSRNGLAAFGTFGRSIAYIRSLCVSKPRRLNNDGAHSAHSLQTISSARASRNSFRSISDMEQEVWESAGDVLANWAPPELILTKQYMQSSDIYSLGIVFWEVVSRSLPFIDEPSQVNLRKLVCLLHIFFFMA